MSPFEPRVTNMEDVKLTSQTNATDKDVEGGAPPSYPIHETEELVVGGPRRCHRVVHWFRARRNRAAEGRRNGRCNVLSKVLRAFKFIVAAWVVLSAVHLTMAGMTARKAYKSLKCIPVTPSELQDGLAVTIPVGKSKDIIVHDSLSGGDALITHDESVPKGSVQFAVTFANGTKPDAVYDGCVTRIRRSTVVGLIPREDHGERAKISSFTIRVPASLSHPSVKFLGHGGKHLSDNRLRKIIRWWRQKQGKKQGRKCSKKMHRKEGNGHMVEAPAA
ncbi:hypothetical protein JB92DRAFT_3044558 [Gautieria morchelliformis]|nr:hypothetical protein JB92DRAFT_3044558 [Gautieria morchelliformis]